MHSFRIKVIRKTISKVLILVYETFTKNDFRRSISIAFCSFFSFIYLLYETIDFDLFVVLSHQKSYLEGIGVKSDEYNSAESNGNLIINSQW